MLFTQIEFLVFFIVLLGCLVGNSTKQSSQDHFAGRQLLLLCILGLAVPGSVARPNHLGLCDWNVSVEVNYIRATPIIDCRESADQFGYPCAAFKYCNFFLSSLQHLLAPIGIHVGTLSIILPLGISFYTFRTLSYTIDVYRRRLEPCTSLLDYAVFVSFFPTMVAGPICKGVSKLLPQLTRSVTLSLQGVLFGCRSFVIGVFMKVFVADRIAIFNDYVFGNVAVFNSLTVWLAVVGYSIQLYCDFAGYSRMAIGVAQAMGYEVPENFNFPYLSRNIGDFWRRWHITLSNWIRDYIYISLGGQSKGRDANLSQPSGCYDFMRFVAWSSLDIRLLGGAATFLILEPAPFAGRFVRTRLYCHERALWKLRWFLNDFNYDAELLAADELDDRRAVGLEGVVRLAYWGSDGHRRLDVQGFAPSERWADLSVHQPPCESLTEGAQA